MLSETERYVSCNASDIFIVASVLLPSRALLSSILCKSQESLNCWDFLKSAFIKCYLAYNIYHQL